LSNASLLIRSLLPIAAPGVFSASTISMWTKCFLQNFQVRVILDSLLVDGLNKKSPVSLSCNSKAALLEEIFLNFSNAILLA